MKNYIVFVLVVIACCTSLVLSGCGINFQKLTDHELQSFSPPYVINLNKNVEFFNDYNATSCCYDNYKYLDYHVGHSAGRHSFIVSIRFYSMFNNPYKIQTSDEYELDQISDYFKIVEDSENILVNYLESKGYRLEKLKNTITVELPNIVYNYRKLATDGGEYRPNKPIGPLNTWMVYDQSKNFVNIIHCVFECDPDPYGTVKNLALTYSFWSTTFSKSAYQRIKPIIEEKEK